MLQIVTANRLRDGRVVFLTASSQWSESVTESAVAADEDAATRLLAVGDEAERRCEVIAPYLIEVEGPTLRPVAMREAIRAKGPTVLDGIA